jgi:hypothetical protein
VTNSIAAMLLMLHIIAVFENICKKAVNFNRLWHEKNVTVSKYVAI